MWQKSYTQTFKGLTQEQIWKAWSDVASWPSWDEDIESATLEGPFKKGSFFTMKPKGWKPVRLELTEAIKNKTYTDCTRFLGATMYGCHEVIDVKDGVKLTTTMTVTGILSFLWIRLVAQNIVETLPIQMAGLVRIAKSFPKK